MQTECIAFSCTNLIRVACIVRTIVMTVYDSERENFYK